MDNIKIDINNYEAFLLDYEEGNLNSTEIAALEMFISENPQLNISLENEVLPFKVEPTDSASYNYKNLLKENNNNFINEADIEQIACFVADGFFSENELKIIEKKFENNFDFKNLVNVYCKTKINPNKSVIYKNKENLKRKNTVILPVWKTTMAVAASVLLLLGIYLFLPNNIENETTLISQKNTSEKIDEIEKEKISESNINTETQNTEIQTVAVNKNHFSKTKSEKTDKNIPQTHDRKEFAQALTSEIAIIPVKPVRNSNEYTAFSEAAQEYINAKQEDFYILLDDEKIELQNISYAYNTENKGFIRRLFSKFQTNEAENYHGKAPTLLELAMYSVLAITEKEDGQTLLSINRNEEGQITNYKFKTEKIYIEKEIKTHQN